MQKYNLFLNLQASDRLFSKKKSLPDVKTYNNVCKNYFISYLCTTKI